MALLSTKRLKAYDPTQVIAIIGGIPVPHEGIECGYDEEQYDFFAGVQGEPVRTKNANRLGTIIVKVLQSNEANDGLSTAQALGALVPVFIKDFNGTTLHAMAEGTIVDLPKKTYTKTGDQVNEWKVRGVITTAFIGSNGTADLIGG